MNLSGLFSKNVKPIWAQYSEIHFFFWIGTIIAFKNVKVILRDPQKESIFIPVLNLEKLNALESSGAQCEPLKIQSAKRNKMI